MAMFVQGQKTALRQFSINIATSVNHPRQPGPVVLGHQLFRAIDSALNYLFGQLQHQDRALNMLKKTCVILLVLFSAVLLLSDGQVFAQKIGRAHV